MRKGVRISSPPPFPCANQGTFSSGESRFYEIKLDPHQPVHAAPVKGYRPCVAIVVTDSTGKVLLARRSGKWENAWQFPQGGIETGESPIAACLRELGEETGFQQGQVEVIGHAPYWLNYDIPPKVGAKEYPGKNNKGQVQAWFLLKAMEDTVDLDQLLAASTDDEFDLLRWVEPATAVDGIVDFKRDAYSNALGHFAGSLMADNAYWTDLA